MVLKQIIIIFCFLCMCACKKDSDSTPCNFTSYTNKDLEISNTCFTYFRESTHNHILSFNDTNLIYTIDKGSFNGVGDILYILVHSSESDSVPDGKYNIQHNGGVNTLGYATLYQGAEFFQDGYVGDNIGFELGFINVINNDKSIEIEMNFIDEYSNVFQGCFDGELIPR